MKVHIMGKDERIIRCARVSHGKESRVTPERDVKLLRYLYNNRHASPFEHIIIAFEATREQWHTMMDEIPTPTVQLHYANNYIWTNLRHYANAPHAFPPEVTQALRIHTPAATAIILGEKPTHYTLDIAYIREQRNLPAGWIALLDALELNTLMDYYTFIIYCPLFIARQWQRHRFCSYNELSRRYTSSNIEFYTPHILRQQSITNTQSSLPTPPDNLPADTILQHYQHITQQALTLYHTMVNNNIARELARSILPQSMYTKFYWTVPRIALDNFMALRNHPHAQWEIQQFAQAITDLVGYKGTDKLTKL